MNRKPFTVDSYKAGIKAICRNGQEPKQLTHFETSGVFAGEINNVLHLWGDNQFIPLDRNYDLFE